MTTQLFGRFESTINHTCQTRIIQKAELLREKKERKERQEIEKRNRRKRETEKKQHNTEIISQRNDHI